MINISNNINAKANLRSLPHVKKSQDPLFWALYLGNYGKDEYLLKKNIINTEMNEKKQISEKFFKLGSKEITNQLCAKITKINCGKIAENILTLPKMPIDSIFACCIFYECNIILVNLEQKTCLRFERKSETIKTIVIYKENSRSLNLFVDDNEKIFTLIEINEKFFHLINEEKPLKGISSYKVSDLENIANCLGMVIEKPIKKNILYENIVLHAVWK